MLPLNVWLLFYSNFNIIPHMKDCIQQLIQKEEKSDNKKYQFCGISFVQKSNRYPHINSPHAGKMSDYTTTIRTFLSDLESQPGSS